MAAQIPTRARTLASQSYALRVLLTRQLAPGSTCSRQVHHEPHRPTCGHQRQDVASSTSCLGDRCRLSLPEGTPARHHLVTCRPDAPASISAGSSSLYPPLVLTPQHHAAVTAHATSHPSHTQVRLSSSSSTTTPTTSSSSSSSSSSDDAAASSHAGSSTPGQADGHAASSGAATAAHDEDVHKDPAQVVLSAALPFVLECGWTEAAMLEGARTAGLSPAVLSVFSRKEAHLVEFFMDECRAKFQQESQERTAEMLEMDDLGQRLALVVRMRLEQQALYTSTWAQALSIQALPLNLPRTAEQRMQLVASMWAAAGERTRSDLEARALCTMLSAVYTASELFMITDFSAGYEDTWQFVQRRMSEGLQAFKGISIAQEQIHQASIALIQKLGLPGLWPSSKSGGLGTHTPQPHSTPQTQAPPTEVVPGPLDTPHLREDGQT